MKLPRRIPKKAKRSERWRSQAHCTFVRNHECCVPGCSARPIEVAHVRRGSDGGTGRKPSDMRGLADTFAIASPRAMQIREAKNG